MPVLHSAIPYTGSTADQAVSTVIVQLGAARHLTRPLILLLYVVVVDFLLRTRFDQSIYPCTVCFSVEKHCGFVET